MSVLSMFPPPPPKGYVTVCEENAELVAAPNGGAMRSLHFQGQNYPEVNISQELLRPSTSRISARSAFLEPDETPRKRMLQAWYEHGLTGVLEELAAYSQKNKMTAATNWMKSTAGSLLAAVRWINSLHGALFPHLAMSNDDLIAEFSPNLDRSNSCICCFAWHPHTCKFAVSLRDDSIKVFTSAKPDIVPVLKHRLQKGVACLAWKYMSASVLAVACHSCILVWNVDPTSLASRPSTSSVQVLIEAGHSPVTSLAWCPQGGALISGSPTDTALMVWDVVSECGMALRRVGGGGVTQLNWSPEGSKLLAGSPSTLFRVWSCRTWECEKWADLSGRCQCSCWSPDGSTLLFVSCGEPIVYSLKFKDDEAGDCAGTIGGSKTAMPCLDLAEIEADGYGVVGGAVHAMVWDAKGERLAIQFRDCGAELIALFQTRIHPTLEILPCGYIRACANDIPVLICFQPKFDDGALLTIVGSKGSVSFVPLYFMSQTAITGYTNFQRPICNDVTQSSLFSTL